TDLTVTMSSDNRRSVFGTLQGRVRYNEEVASRLASVAPTLNLRPSGRSSLQLAPRITWTRSAEQYVRTLTYAGSPLYLIGGLEQTTFALTARASFTLTPALSLDV